MNIGDGEVQGALFAKEQFGVVVNFPPQVGERYRTENPPASINTNLVGLPSMLEGGRRNIVKNLEYASSNSVYGLNAKQPFTASDTANHPIGLYAAKKIQKDDGSYLFTSR